MARKKKKKATSTRAKTRTTARKKKTTTARRRTTKTQEMLLVGTKTKEALKGYDLNVSADALEGLNQMVYWYIEQAAKRTIANGRKTVRAHDFVAS